MESTRHLRAVILLALTLAILDMAWFTVIRTYLNSFFSSLQGGRPLQLRIIPAVLVYIFLGTGLWAFVLKRKTNSPVHKVWYGALFGLVVYGTYDLTNYATLYDYTLQFCVTDMVWGTVACSIVALVYAETDIL